MKKILENAKNWLTFGLFASLIMIISLIIYTKARNSSSSWVTVDSSNPAALYVGENETLTAAKRNRLVQNAVWEEVLITDTALFDTGCERKWQRNDGSTNNIFYANNIENNKQNIKSADPAGRVNINYLTKWTTTYPPSSSRSNLHIWKKCK